MKTVTATYRISDLAVPGGVDIRDAVMQKFISECNIGCRNMCLIDIECMTIIEDAITVEFRIYYG